jgi:hypothetical protein
MDGGVPAFALLAATGSALVFAFVPSLRGPEEAGSSLLVHHGRRVQTPDLSFHRLIAARSWLV